MKYSDCNKHFNFCTQPWFNLFLHNSGRIQPCCMNSTSIGNILKHDINDIWNGEKIKQIRKSILARDYASAGCKTGCPIRYQLEQESNICSFPQDWGSTSVVDKQFEMNFKRLIDNLEHRLIDANNLPLYVDIQPTEACNMACIMCHQKHGNKTNITSDAIARFLNWSDVIHTLRFQGGEIFVDPNFSTFLHKLKNKLQPFQKIHIITNGSLIDEKSIRKLTAPPNPIHFIVSIDAVEAKIYKKIRRSPLFHKAWKSLDVLAHIQKDIGRNDIVQWNFVVMKSNFHQIDTAIRIATELNTKIYFQPIIGSYPEENIFDYDTIRPERTLEYLDDCIQLTSDFSVPNASLQNLQKRLSKGITL